MSTKVVISYYIKYEYQLSYSLHHFFFFLTLIHLKKNYCKIRHLSIDRQIIKTIKSAFLLILGYYLIPMIMFEILNLNNKYLKQFFTTIFSFQINELFQIINKLIPT